MGTSNGFRGSGGRDARDLREALADWLTDPPTSAQDRPQDPDDDDVPGRPVPPINLISALRILARSGGGGDGPGGGGRSSQDGSARSSGGARRSLGSTSRATARAGALATAFASGDRETLSEAGLDYGELRALGDVVAVGSKIVDAAFSSQADGTIEDEESRVIAASVVEWILESPEGQTPTPDEIVRYSIELMITEVTLTEVGGSIRAEPSRERRASSEQEIRESAQVYASQVSLTGTGATEREISHAIEGGVRELVSIFGESK